MADNERHYFANDGTDWTSSPSDDPRRDAEERDDEAAQGNGPSATNEPRLRNSVVKDSGSKNG